jgi:hypothetical protein
MDGYARAKATFQPRTLPVPCGVSTHEQPVAQTNGGGVYYIDGAGVVRALRVGQQPQVIARFVQQADQYETWFTVNPDGTKVVAGILTFPQYDGLQPTQYCAAFSGIYYFDYEIFEGGAERTVTHRAGIGVNGSGSIWFPVTWRGGGPVIMDTQVGTPLTWWPGGGLLSADDTGPLNPVLGGQFCFSASITPAGLIPCTVTPPDTLVTVHDSSGNLIWKTSLDNENAITVHLSSDGQSITDGTKVERRSTGLVAMPAGFQVEGWLDNNTVMGRPLLADNTPGDLSWINLSDPTAVHDLGFKGDFVGTIG